MKIDVAALAALAHVLRLRTPVALIHIATSLQSDLAAEQKSASPADEARAVAKCRAAVGELRSGLHALTDAKPKLVARAMLRRNASDADAAAAALLWSELAVHSGALDRLAEVLKGVEADVASRIARGAASARRARVGATPIEALMRDLADCIAKARGSNAERSGVLRAAVIIWVASTGRAPSLAERRRMREALRR